jgi:hypothetical protein
VSIVQPLLALQEIDTRIRALQQEARDIPVRKDQEKTRLRGALAAVADAQTSAKAAQARVDEAELEIKDRREKINKLRQQQLTLRTNKEFAALNSEVAGIEAQIETFEGRQVTALDGIVPAKSRLEEFDKKLQEEKKIVEGYTKELDARLAVVQAELKQAEAERAEAAKAVPANILLAYTRLADRRWPPVVALEGNACGGCHLTQPPSVSHNVRRNTGLVVCGMCGRILHLPQ